MLRLTLYFFLFFTSCVKCFSCVFCETIEQQDAVLNTKYCPHCVDKYRANWHLFINAIKIENKHVAESYLSQYTPLNFINKTFYKNQSEHYGENIFIEFVNMLWSKLNSKEFCFRDPHLEALLSNLLAQDDPLINEQRYEELSHFYKLLKFLFLALYFECQQDFQRDYTQYVQKLLKKIDRVVVFANAMK